MEAEAWLRERMQLQDSLPKYADPVLSSADVLKKAQALDGYLFSLYIFVCFILVERK